MENQQTQEQQHPKEFRKYCPFRQEGSRCSSFCAIWFHGTCSLTIVAAYFATMYQQYAQEGDAGQ